MTSSPGCWAAFGQVIACEYSDPALADVHRLSVDAYAAQHPGTPSPQSMKSVGIHLIRLCFTVERGVDVREANDVMGAISKVKHRFGWLSPPTSLGDVTVADVVGAPSAEVHRAAVHGWSRSVWEAWAEHHETVRGWVSDLRLA